MATATCLVSDVLLLSQYIIFKISVLNNRTAHGVTGFHQTPVIGIVAVLFTITHCSLLWI